MRNKMYGPGVPADPVMKASEPAPEKEIRKRPISGYGPSLPLKTTSIDKK